MALGSCRQRATLIMADRLGRLHKIIITQQWSESPRWHFHTTSDLWGNLRGHDQGQGSARGLCDQGARWVPSCRFLLFFSQRSSCFFFSLSLFPSSSICLSIAHTLFHRPGPIETSHPLGAQRGKQEKINREDE